MKLSTLSVLTPYLFSIATFWIMIKRDKKSLKNKANVLLALLAFIFSIWVIIGCGQEVVFYGFILLMIGIPFYIYINNNSDD
jgi:APA family basic amino acid/polyamine antiporter